MARPRRSLLSSDAASVEDRFAQMEKEDEISRILSELKARAASSQRSLLRSIRAPDGRIVFT